MYIFIDPEFTGCFFPDPAPLFFPSGIFAFLKLSLNKRGMIICLTGRTIYGFPV